MKACYYYQTFIGLSDILNNPINTDVIIISSLHFDTVNKEIDIFLNNNVDNIGQGIVEKATQEILCKSLEFLDLTIKDMNSDDGDICEKISKPKNPEENGRMKLTNS